MTHSVAIVTAADDAYFPLLSDLLASIKDQKYGDIFVLDLGLEEKQIATLERAYPGIAVTSISDDREKLAFKAKMYKCLLPDILPGYQTYIWIDADIWFQDVTAIADFVSRDERQEISIVPQDHPSYLHHEKALLWRRSRYRAMFGPELAEIMIQKPVLNSGFWAIDSDSDLWDRWRRVLADKISTCPPKRVSDQAALNYLVWIEGVTYKPLSPLNNWMSHLAVPKWHPRRQYLGTPDEKKEVIRAIHLTSVMKDFELSVRLPRGRRRLRLRYADVERVLKNRV